MLGGLSVGDGEPVALIGVLNASPESFYQGSVYTTPDDLADAALAMVAAGAQIIDVGAMSTAPYLTTQISEAEETQRLRLAVEAIAKRVTLPISVDTTRSGPAAAGLEAGATIVNDFSGLKADPEMAVLVAAKRAGLVVMAHERAPPH